MMEPIGQVDFDEFSFVELFLLIMVCNHSHRIVIVRCVEHDKAWMGSFQSLPEDSTQIIINNHIITSLQEPALLRSYPTVLSLNISSNFLTILPSIASFAPNLKYLLVSRNFLSSFPDTLHKHDTLQILVCFKYNVFYVILTYLY